MKKKAKSKTKKKSVKKKISKKKPAKPKKKAAAKKSAKKTAPAIEGKLVGEVTHYFPHVNAAVVKIAKKCEICLGDRLYFKGHTTDFKLSVSSLQIDRSPVEKGMPGDEIGIEIPDRVRHGDSVYKIKS